MHREPVNPDDPQMTAYALGEMSLAEAAEFEARLQDSPKARRELAEMREIMALLGEGLRGEWEGEKQSRSLHVFEPVLLPSPARDSVIIEGQFRPVKRSFAAAAAVAALFLVGSAIFVSQRSGGLPGGAGELVASAPQIPAAEASYHVPQLLLADEIEDPSVLDLVGGVDAVNLPVDASYLEADSVIPASFQPALPGGRGFSLDRVDSYLPPIGGFSNGRSPATGMIERRLGRGVQEAGVPTGSVLVSGYVTMGGSEPTAHLLGGFRPVSISGNPVVNEESDLRLLADLNGLKKELSMMIDEMPSQSEERANLERALERSERIASQLKRELAR